MDSETKVIMGCNAGKKIFLKTGAITQLQYDKSYGDLVKKMGMETVAEEILEAEKP